MKQTLLTGTGRGARALGFTHPAAGKTGTTNDKKDAWFAGFTPLHTAVVWVGYDDNSPHGLTGGGGAVPIWTTYMKGYASVLPAVDFNWPEGVERVQVSPEQQLAAGVPAKEADKLESIELIFKK
jgi:membrane carboxypeptidase/penicillin-binding protein